MVEVKRAMSQAPGMAEAVNQSLRNRNGGVCMCLVVAALWWGGSRC